jgi:hypothetical protein
VSAETSMTDLWTVEQSLLQGVESVDLALMVCCLWGGWSVAGWVLGCATWTVPVLARLVSSAVVSMAASAVGGGGMRRRRSAAVVNSFCRRRSVRFVVSYCFLSSQDEFVMPSQATAVVTPFVSSFQSDRARARRS